jgi:ankyrin repeat protein
VEKGADVNARDKNDGTPLHYAVARGHLSVVEFLIEKGADLNARNRYGKTPLNISSP